MGIDAIIWNIGLGIVASAAWEAMKLLFTRISARDADAGTLGTRFKPFLRNAVIFAAIFAAFTIIVAMYSPAHIIL